MLAKNPTPAPSMTVAYPRGHVVRLIVGLRCPACQGPLRAADVEADAGNVRLICGGCHRDVFRIEASL